MLLFSHLFFSARELLLAVLVLVIGSTLSACGYSPLYDERSSSDLTVKKHLELIQIQPISDRIGQHLHNKLLVHINPKGKPSNPLYILSVKLEETSSNLGVKKSAVVTRGNLRVTAVFTLSQVANVADGIKARRLMTAKSTTISSYDIPQGQYVALAAVKDAQARAIKEIADDIRTRLGVYFRQRTQ